jgi:hypothetical protein
MLQEILLSVCLLLQPLECKDIHLQVVPESHESLLVPFHCMRQGQIVGQKWIEEHPGWTIARWKCPRPEYAKLRV